MMFLGAGISTAQDIDTDLINLGIGKVFDQEYEEARAYILAGGKGRKKICDFLINWIQLEENDPDKMKHFEQIFQKQVSVLKEEFQSEDPEYNFLVGMWNGLMALFLVRENRMLSAYKFGRKAFEMLRTCLMLNPEKYDAYYGLGLYHKMKYELGSGLWFVPDSAKDEKIAKKYFNLAQKKGIFTRELSKYMLIELSI